MKKLGKALKAGAAATAEGFGPGAYAVAGKQVRCGHCGGLTFVARAADAPSLIGTALVCTACSHVEWFGSLPDRL